MASRRCAAPLVALALLVLSHYARGQVVNSEWNTGNGNWNVAGNWFPSDVPDNGVGVTYDVQIGNRPVAAGAAVTFIPEDGTSDSMTSLTMSGGADLLTNGFQVFVVGQTTISGIGSSIRVDPNDVLGIFSLDTDNLDLNGGALQMNGGIANVDVLLEVNAGGSIQGRGLVNVGDGDGVVEEALENSGIIRATGISAGPSTLTLETNGVDTIDLDGDSETGLVDADDVSVNANIDTTTLVIDAPLSDAFSGTLEIGQRDTVTFNQAFTLAGAAVAMNGGAQTATLNGTGDATSITTTAFTVAGSATIANDMTFVGTLNTVTTANGSTLMLGGTVAVPDASMFVFGANSFFVVSGSTTIIEGAGDFNWDGAGAVTTTVQGSGHLSILVDEIDNNATNSFDGTINLNDDGDVSVNVAAATWDLVGALNKNGAGTSVVSGDRVVVTGDINVSAGTLDMPATTLSPGAGVAVNGTLLLGGASILAGPTSVHGAGLLRMEGTSTVSATTTISTATFDWDGLGSGTLHTINDGVVFTINSTTLDADGDMDDPVSLGGNGAQLIVNGTTQWTQTGVFNANTTAAGTATIGGTSRAIFTNTVNVDGNTTADARVTFGASSTTAIDAAMGLRLSGGTLVDVNRIDGATINGPGTLRADPTSGLHGFGTINAPIDFDGFSTLKGNDGTLTINGAIVDVGSIGTSDVDGVLNVVNAWNSSGADFVDLLGGELTGGTLTIGNAEGLTGFGLVSARVVNEQRIRAQAGTLVVETALDNNDWDGLGGAGQLSAAPGRTLELRDVGAAFGFTGTVSADAGGRVFANGFALDFNPGSSLNLTAGTYESTHSTDIGGAVTVAAGGESTIEVENNVFLSFESGSATTLNGNLRLENNNIIIEAGATFSGGGALIVPDGSNVVADNLADVGVLLDMQGGFRPGNSEGIGRIDLLDYQQANTGKLFVEIKGTALNAFDRLVASGDVVLDGFLSIDIDDIAPMTPFVPMLGQTFNIITGNTVTGEFDFADVSGMPAGLAFHIEYLANAVQLQVVNKPIFSADFDEDGDVDSTDLVIWDGAFDLNQLGDADGDNDSDGNDFLLWQRQVGSAPVVPAAGAVPEPATPALIAMAFLAGLSRKRRR